MSEPFIEKHAISTEPSNDNCGLLLLLYTTTTCGCNEFKKIT